LLKSSLGTKETYTNQNGPVWAFFFENISFFLKDIEILNLVAMETRSYYTHIYYNFKSALTDFLNSLNVLLIFSLKNLNHAQTTPIFVKGLTRRKKRNLESSS
jgi:hypothetical protein